MSKKYEVYGSVVHVLELDSIPMPEGNEELFNVGQYPIIAWSSKIEIKPEQFADAKPHTPGSRGAIGVVGTKTVLVDVECNKESRGLTVKELAQFMVSVLGARVASLTPFEPIIAYTAYTEEVEEVATEDLILPGGGEVLKAKPRKKKGGTNAEEA